MSTTEVLEAVFNPYRWCVISPLPAQADADLREALATLEPVEAFVLRHRFGLEGESPKTRRSIGLLRTNGGNSPTRMAQIEAKALRKLRHPSRARVFDKYLVEADL